jgi:hypothetical protein
MDGATKLATVATCLGCNLAGQISIGRDLSRVGGKWRNEEKGLAGKIKKNKRK